MITYSISKYRTLVGIIICLFSTSTFSLPSLSPWKLMDNTFCRAFGSEDASPECQEHIHEYLDDFGIKNPDTVPIRKMSLEAAKEYNCPYIVRNTGIWLNEHMLSSKQAMRSPNRIYMLSRSAAHYTVSNKLAVLLSLKYITDKIPVAAPIIDFASSAFIFSRMYKKTSQDNPIQKTDILKDAALLTALHWLPAATQYGLNKFIVSYSHSIEKQVDQATADMLCGKGHSNVVKGVIQNLEYTLMQGGRTTNRLQPSIQEIINCLQESVTNWEETHKKTQADDERKIASECTESTVGMDN